MAKSKNAGLGIHIGINEKDRAAIAGGLSRLLADTYTLYLTTHNFHWNVTGPMFNTLHVMFMTQYTELWNAVDPIAERIRALGHAAPGSYGQFGKLATVPDAPATPPKALEMVRILVQGQRSGGTHRARAVPAGGQGQRPTDDRPADPAPRRARKDRVDAAVAAGGVRPQPRRQGALTRAPAYSMSSMCLGQLALSSVDSARSASRRPPVWQRAQ